MARKEFQAESKRLMDLMINSIYTHKEIFLRELISNASDAIDKLYYRTLEDGATGLSREDFFIRIDLNKDARTLTITDNGVGMTQEELDNNLGVIAKSGSLQFKQEAEQKEDVDIIGQFGVGFYSAFMVSDKVTVESRAFGSDTAWKWESEGVEGYEITPCGKADRGTVITLHLKPDTEDERYSEFLEQYRIQGLVKKYSDYIRYPIRMEMVHTHLKEGTGVDGKEPEYESHTELETLNSMVPIWKKAKSEVTDEELNAFYKEKFFDWQDPLKVIRTSTEGAATYTALLFLPKQRPYGLLHQGVREGPAALRQRGAHYGEVPGPAPRLLQLCAGPGGFPGPEPEHLPGDAAARPAAEAHRRAAGEEDRLGAPVHAEQRPGEVRGVLEEPSACS